MENGPTEREERKMRVENLLVQPIREECYMVSKCWWDKWWNYVTSSEVTFAGQINNTPFM